MKLDLSLLVVILSILISLGIPAFAVDLSAAGASPQNGVLLQNGTLYRLQNGQREVVLGDATFPNGMVVSKNGIATLQGGQIVILSDGQMITEQGQVISAVEKKPIGQTGVVESNSASPTGATRNMAPIRGDAR